MELDFLRQVVELAVVTHIVQLRLVALDQLSRLRDFVFLRQHVRLILLNAALIILHARLQSGYFVFQVLHFQWQLPTQGFQLVDLCHDRLQMVQ